jgi:predicted porin
MNKKLMAVAVAGALAAPVAMAQSNVTISGRLSLGVDTYTAAGATQAASPGLTSRNRVWDNGSRLNFAGSEDLGNGMKAEFYVETGFNGDNGLLSSNNSNNASLVTATNVGGLGNRIAYVGIATNAGSLRLGRQHVFWTNGLADQTQTNYLQAAGPFATGSFGSGMGVGVNRNPNTVQYISPNISGFQATVSWSPSTQEAVQGVTSTNAVLGTNTVASANGKLWGLTAQWTGGPFQVAWDWVESKGNSTYVTATVAGAVVQGKVQGNKLRGAWSYQPGAVLGLIWTQSQVTNGGTNSSGKIAAASGLGVDAGSMTTLRQSAWTLNWEHMVGNTRLLAQYAKAGNITGCNASETITSGSVGHQQTGASACDQTGSRSYLLGAQYLLSKRTSIMMSYNRIKNDANYFADYGTGGNPAHLTTTNGGYMTVGNTGSSSAPGLAGADPVMWGVGIQHNF